ncbi:hypothetical protein [Paraliomyxa miuraensis]|uniref:hypothetical protein n=1 Tax=Paraliomyxa miuraensis TaxID=376150 RepID=UPI002255C714|nr:hypothetical protein [Paraliomyxa miuraensis]MCX4243686.1 hypothetical protein [Paraliomyxa miuraensis]
MTATRTLAAALALGSVLGISCYSEPQPPSTYRYACNGDGDCNGDEFCRRGRCERPCTQITAANDCPFEDGYVACYNGACVSTCELDQGYCPSGLECIDLGIDLGGSSSPFGGGSSAAVGICGVQCEADDDICPEGEVCVPDFGACAVDCSQGQDCPDGYICFFGLCAPESGFPSGDDGGSESSGMGANADDEERR